MQQFGPKGRLEDRRMLTGQGCYVADWSLPGQAYGHFLRSDRPHARIVSIDASAALARSGVIAVLTGADCAAAGFQSLPVTLNVKGREGTELVRPHRPALALAKVCFAGEPVALVVAESGHVAEDAAGDILIEYEDLPHVIAVEDALLLGAPRIHDAAPNNVVFEFESGDEAATRNAFENATRVIRLSVNNTRVIGNPMEPRACLAAFDALSGDYTLYACTQGAPMMRAQLAAVLDVPQETVRIGAKDVGGGFGVRFNIYPEYCAALLAARKTGRPVKWVGSRSEVFLADEQGRDVLSHGEMALDATGRIIGLRFEMLANLGAYLCPNGPFINTVVVVSSLTGVYDVQACHARIRLAVTNTAPVAAYRGAGRPVLSYILERMVERAACELKIDPAELRRRNLIPPAQFPYRVASGSVYDCGDFPGVLDAALGAADWAGFEARRTQSAARGRLRGRGMATFVEATGTGAAAADQVEMRWRQDGLLTLYGSSHSHGQGHETTYAQIVSGVLGIPLDSIRLETADPSVFLLGNASGGSRSLLGVGSVFQLGARELVEKAKLLAAEHLEVSATDLVFADGRFGIAGTDRGVSLQELVKKFASMAPHPLDLRFEHKFGATYPNGCHIAEVEIDPETGESEIVSYLSCDDVGNVVNHQIVEGQMQGGLTQGAGQVFLEQAVYDRETGQLLTGSFMDYGIPRAGMVAGLTLLGHPVPTETNPLGAKGVGEAGVTGSLPALMNAVLDALGQVGVTHFDMPASPLRVWTAIRQAQVGHPAALAVVQRT